jgi:hypothetical protein
METASKLRNACGSGVHRACAASLRFDTGGFTSSLALLDKPALIGTAEVACSEGDSKSCAALAFLRTDQGGNGHPDWERACAAGCVDACDPGNDAYTCFDAPGGVEPTDSPPRGTAQNDGTIISE